MNSNKKGYYLAKRGGCNYALHCTAYDASSMSRYPDLYGFIDVVEVTKAQYQEARASGAASFAEAKEIMDQIRASWKR